MIVGSKADENLNGLFQWRAQLRRQMQALFTRMLIVRINLWYVMIIKDVWHLALLKIRCVYLGRNTICVCFQISIYAGNQQEFDFIDEHYAGTFKEL